MQKFLGWILTVALIVFLLPFFAVNFKKISKSERIGFDDKNKITVLIDGQNIEMPFEEYITGVVCAEMPALFETEALKAQAVAARTYTVSKINANGRGGHNGADICTLPSHCQAYVSKDELYQKWGEKTDEFYNKISSAVLFTSGEILVYQNEPIRAVFHSSNKGRTESAADVWGGDFPYLQSVESAGEELSPKYQTEYSVDYTMFCDKIKEKYPNADLSLSIGEFTRTAGGAADEAVIFGVKITGVEMRSLFMLKSANFDMKKDGENIIFTVYGYGHGVGMSQYGANYMASQGKSYIEILQNYYRGAKISMYNH